MSHETAVLAFRLYGEFDWPPVLPLQNNKQKKRAVVEIWFVPEDRNPKQYNAMLSWAVGQPNTSTDFTIQDNAFQLAEYELKQHFEKQAGAIWINQGTINNNQLKEVLGFRGAVLFEQLALNAKLKWPLISSFSYRKNSQYHSELVIGGTKNADFSFRLGLPAPVRQSSNNSFKCPKVFYIEATYESSNKPSQIISFKGLNRLSPVKTTLKFEHTKSVLGQFGFAIKPINKQIFAYKEHDTNYFPSINHEAVFDFLKIAGFDITNLENLAQAGPENARNEDQTSLSPKGISDFMWRLNLQANKNASGGSQNVTVESGQFCLKLTQELSPLNIKRNSTFINFNSEDELLCDLKLSRKNISDDQLAIWLSGTEVSIANILTIRMSHHSPLHPLDFLHQSLNKVLAAQPQSFFPIFIDKQAPSHSTSPTNIPLYLTKIMRSLCPLGSNINFNTNDNYLLPGWNGNFTASLPNFMDKDISLICTIEPNDYYNPEEIKYVISTLRIKSSKKCFGRLGALNFELSRELLGSDESSITIKRTASGFSYSLNLRLNVKAVQPVTIDIPWGDRDIKNAPLLIPEQGTNHAGEFTLVVKETFGDQEDWHLTAELLDNTSADSTLQTFNVISEQPFSIFRFARVSLSSSGDEGNNVVATYDSDQRTWQFKKVADSYHYVLPPQAIGETTDKPGRLEIHDTAPQAGEVIRPYPDSSNPLRTHLVEYRLTPSTELWIKPSDLTRNYFLPEWSAHEIFRQRNDFGLGVALLGLRGEFLYGLSVGVDVSKEQGVSKQARVAEIEALMGRLPQDAKATSVNEQPLQGYLLKRWDQLRPALQRRHERLELWAQDPTSKQIFAPARFTDGVSFALRQSALHRAPVLDPDFTQANSNDVTPADNTTPFPEPEGLNGNIRYHPQGLAGGVLWPVEFWNLFKALCDHPRSSGGSLEQVALSPTGGDANQKALFLNGLLSIISETRGGFVQRQQVEVLGRIGAHWHRAKHVVVYERTVNPSAQFAPEYAVNGSLSTRSRRPILRKVSEYIELLQPERFYPDGAGDVKQSGFLKSIRFNSIRIAVDSAWGEEVDKVGYKIPLWNQYSARSRPQVYPMPDVVFNLLCEGSTDDDSSAKQCLDPDNIYFFTDIESRNPDTDNWVARIGIDAVLSLTPGDLTKLLDKENQQNTSDYKPSTSRILPGYRRFTWRLATGGPKARINAGYGDKPIYAEVESISF
ncbi:MAG TPA: hypothetical protein VIM85_07805, partial [Pseudomonadales bacterium]